MYLLDTNVLSAVRKLRRFPKLADWLDSIDIQSMRLATRNVKDFLPTGVAVVNPVD